MSAVAHLVVNQGIVGNFKMAATSCFVLVVARSQYF